MKKLGKRSQAVKSHGRSFLINFAKSYKPTKRQKEAHKAREKYTLFGGAMGGGKSKWLCAEGIQLSLDFPGNVGYICRHERATFMTTTLQSLLETLPKDMIAVHHESAPSYIDIINGSRMYYGGLRSTTRGGFGKSPIDRIKSMNLGWFAIDEATETTLDFFLVLCSRLRLLIPGISYRGLLASNPEPGWVLNRFILEPRSDYRFVRALPTDNPYLPDGYVSSLYKDFPREWIEKYLEGNWEVSSDELFIYPYSWITSAVSCDLPAVEDAVVEFGVDVARGGNRGTIVMRKGNKVTVLYEGVLRDTTVLENKVVECYKKHLPSKIRIDTTGVGGPVFDHLKKKKDPKLPVEEFIAGAKSYKPEKYANLRAEAYWRVRLLLEEGEIDLPNNRSLISEMSAIKYKIVGSKKLQVWSKEDIKLHEGGSPDLADGMVMAFGGKPRPKIRMYLV